MMTPEEVVEKQLVAYNAHDIDAFMATYSPTIQLMKFPGGETISQGAESMRVRYGEFFETRKPHVEIARRIVTGNLVIDEEQGHYTGGTFQAVAIYEVVDELIQRVWFVQD